jgi:LacI family transcriptional regulator, repressor for deo operon, udp, cdd, tsx, nupC, and nupG
MSNKVTIAEVAKEAGVSIATVSRVLNQREGKIKISEETKSTVQAAAHRLGYQADPFASALRTRRTGLFGAIIRDLRDPFLIKLFIEMQNAARENGIELLLGNANYDISVAGRQANIMVSLWFDGLILLGDMPGDLGVIKQFQDRKKPCVAVACGNRTDLPSINVDEAAGVNMVLDYLSSLGHKRIACVGDQKLLGVKERLFYFNEYATQHELIIEDGYLQECPNDQFKAAQAAATLLGLPIPPTAVFCGTDVIALGVMHQLMRSGIRVPEDISVTGFDDIEEASAAYPSLTTIRQQTDKISHQAIQMVAQMMKNSEAVIEMTAANILIEPELIIRESCGTMQH